MLKTRAPSTSIALSGVSQSGTAAANTSAIQAAIDSGNEVVLPPGTIEHNGLTIKQGVTLRGQGQNVTILKLANAQNKDVIVGDNAYSLFGTNGTGGVKEWSIRDLTIDGNRANQASGTPDVVNGLAFYGTNFELENVDIINCLGHGIRSEWYTFGEDTGGIEATVNNVIIDRTNRHGWWFKGPHDINVDHFVVIDASGEADNTYSGLYLESGNGRFFNGHTWHRSATTNRMKFGVSSSGSSEFVACHFEGARSQVEFRSTGAMLLGCRLYAHQGATGSAMMHFSGNDNIVSGCFFTGATAGDYYAMQFGVPAGTNIAGNMINSCYFSGFSMRTPFYFAADGGNEILDCRGFTSGGGVTAFGGTRSSATVMRYQQGGTVINVKSLGTLPTASAGLLGTDLWCDTAAGNVIKRV